jgi:hypothetical protein
MQPLSPAAPKGLLTRSACAEKCVAGLEAGVVLGASLGAVVMALCYGVGAVLQAIGMREGAPSETLDSRLIVRMFSQLPYLAGLALDGLGFLASLLALRHLPLFLVQAGVAASVGITAVLAARFLEATLEPRHWVALVGLGAGVVALACSAEPGGARSLSRPAQWVVVAFLVPVLAVGVTAAARGRGGAPLLALASGAAFSGVSIAARALNFSGAWWHLFAQPLSYAVAGYGALGAILFAAALERGSVTVAVAIIFAVETVIPSGVGLALLGDSARSGLAPVAVVGFVVTVGSALVLARYAQPAEVGKAARPGAVG